MGSNPILIKIDCHLEVFFIRVPSDKFIFYCCYSGFHWDIRGKLRNPVSGNIIYIFFRRDLIKFEIIFCFHWNIRGT